MTLRMRSEVFADCPSFKKLQKVYHELSEAAKTDPALRKKLIKFNDTFEIRGEITLLESVKKPFVKAHKGAPWYIVSPNDFVYKYYLACFEALHGSVLDGSKCYPD